VTTRLLIGNRPCLSFKLAAGANATKSGRERYVPFEIAVSWIVGDSLRELRAATTSLDFDRENKGQTNSSDFQSVQSQSRITMVADSSTLGFDRPNPNWDGRRGIFIKYELLSRVDGSARFGFGTLFKESTPVCFLIVFPIFCRRLTCPSVCIGTDGG
jgi:hypothetical protein